MQKLPGIGISLVGHMAREKGWQRVVSLPLEMLQTDQTLFVGFRKSVSQTGFAGDDVLQVSNASAFYQQNKS